jgi:hypothetical protein
MTTFESVEITPNRVVNWTRIVFVFLAAVALVALSFTLGRATIGHSASSTTSIRPAAVQNDQPDVARTICRPHVGC